MRLVIKRHQKRRFRGTLMLLLFLFSIMVSMSVSAIPSISAMSSVFAATPISTTAENITARVEVEQQLSGTTGPKTKFYYELKASDNAAPAPEQSEIIIKGEGKASFEIVFHETGIYRYTLQQISQNKKNWSLDTRIYSVEIYVVREEEIDMLSAIVLCYDEAGKKTDAVFVNVYKPPNTNSPGTGEADLFIQWMWFAVISISGAGAVVTVFYVRKKKEGRK